jgi:hypothetical protein
MLFLLTGLLGGGVGALLGLGLASLFGWLVNGSLNFGGWVVVLSLAIVGYFVGWLIAFVVSGIRMFRILTRKIPENFFGMCTGLKETSKPPGKEALTNWLSGRINDLAGLEPVSKIPLTFGMLRERRFVKQKKGEEGIQLRMVTSNLSQNQPFVLPFKYDRLFIYSEREFKRLFPEEIVAYMKNPHAEKTDSGKTGTDESPYAVPGLPGYFYLPEAEHLPVIVATRLSLSFPVLLCAIPLYTVQNPAKPGEGESRALKRSDLQLHWFSDGGIASNFPIQFFDSWLPTRPTFGVNLTSLPDDGIKKGAETTKDDEWFGKGNELLYEEEANKKLDDKYISPTAIPAAQEIDRMMGSTAGKKSGKAACADAIYLPAADDPPFTEWIPFTKKSKRSGKVTRSLFKFLWSIFTTAQNYRDNSQAMLPSYRERIVQIRLADEEGGLNLAMSEETIKRVAEKGNVAGDKLLGFNFRYHQWVRFQVLMSQMEIYLDKTWRDAREDPTTGTRRFNYPTLLKDQLEDENEFPYRREAGWCDNAEGRMKAMGVFIEGWSKEPMLSEKPPQPESILRVTPEL